MNTETQSTEADIAAAFNAGAVNAVTGEAAPTEQPLPAPKAEADAPAIKSAKVKKPTATEAAQARAKALLAKHGGNVERAMDEAAAQGDVAAVKHINPRTALKAATKKETKPADEKTTTQPKETAMKKTTEKKAAPKKSTKPAAKAAPKKPSAPRDSMAGHAYELIKAGKTNAEVLTALTAKYKLPAKHSYYPSWYRAKLVMTEVITKDFAAKHSGAVKAEPKAKKAAKK
jgi:hypothetical protein